MVEEEEQEEDIKLNKSSVVGEAGDSPAIAILCRQERGRHTSEKRGRVERHPPQTPEPPPSRDWQGLVIPDQTSGGAPQRRGGTGDP
ncbi:hypothetical protein Sjap_026312 [Stephania japonica]|uniref:Uncharacterized protein n=1 Tax=Stephania japonica TaxID=461633 RepID=A0AAP0E3C8_9MAGN